MPLRACRMKVVLDECVPVPLSRLPADHDVFTVTFMGLEGGQERSPATTGVEVLVTTDPAIDNEPSHATLPMSVVIVHSKSNNEEDLAI